MKVGLRGPVKSLRLARGPVERLPWLPIICGLKLFCRDWRNRPSRDADAQRDERGKESATAVRTKEARDAPT